MKKDKEFEDGLMEMLGGLFEQDPQGNQASQPQGEQPQGNQTSQPQGSQPQGEQPQGNREFERKTNFDYLSTPNLFTAAPPPNSSTWTDEKKKYYLPLQDGRVGQYLTGKFKGFFDHDGSAGAARYNEYQFRIRLRGTYRMKASLLVEVSPKVADVELEQIEANTPFGKKTFTKEQGWFDDFQDDGVIKVGGDHSELISWSGAKRETDLPDSRWLQRRVEKLRGLSQEAISSVERIIEALYKAIEEYGISQLQLDLDSDEAATRIGRFANKNAEKALNDEQLKTAIRKAFFAKEAEEETEKEQKESIAYDQLAAELTGPNFGYTKKDVQEYIEWIIGEKDLDPNEKLSDQQIAKLSLEVDQKIDSKSKKESTNLSNYLNKLLLTEAKKKGKGKSLEKELGGDIVEAINDVIHSKWFGEGAAIAAGDRKTIFEGNLIEFFAASESNFTAQKREIIENDKGAGVTKMRLEGIIECGGYIWVDARIGEISKRLDVWTFRVHDQPNKPFDTKTFGSAVVRRGLGKLDRPETQEVNQPSKLQRVQQQDQPQGQQNQGQANR